MSITKIIKALNIKFDKAFGLDISDRSVEIIELKKVFRFSVVTYGRAELAPGIVENGLIIDPDALAVKLKTLLKEVKPKRVSTNKTIVSLPESQVFVKCLVVDAKLKSQDLENFILDQTSVSLPIHPDKMYWDFLQKPLADKNKKMIIFVGVPKGVASGYVKFCNSIGLEIVSLGVESLSLARAILKKSDRQSLVVDIGTLSTGLNFFDSNDKINMSVNIPQGGESFTDAIQTTLGIDRAEAEGLKIKFGFSDKPDNKIKPIITPVFENLLKEIKAAIEYYEMNFKQKLDDIYLIGGSSLSPGISSVVKQYLGKEVQTVVNSHNLSLRTLADKEKQFPLFVNVVGLGMLGASAEFSDLNLLRKMPKSEVNRIDAVNLFKFGYLSRVNVIRAMFNNKYVLVILLVIIAFVFYLLLQQVADFGFATASSSIGDLY